MVCKRMLSDKDLKIEKEPCDNPGKGNWRQRTWQVQRVVRLEKGLVCPTNKKGLFGEQNEQVGDGKDQSSWETDANGHPGDYVKDRL